MYDALLVVTAVCCGLNGGVFFAFSTFVSSALATLRPAEGIRAMQAINRTAVTPLFMALFLGTAVLAVLAAVLAVPEGDGLVVVAAVVYVVGSVVLTGTVHVPLNNRVDALDPDDALTHPVWTDYLLRWVRWNHVRTLAGAASCGLLAVALLQS